jgi:hypothetical protein
MFSLVDFFNKGPIFFNKFANKTDSWKFDDATVQFKYNSYGYRTLEFDQVPDEYALVIGCSLTEGHGLHLEQTWSNHYERLTGLPVVNLAKGGSNAEYCARNISNWMETTKTLPKEIIVQWPNPYRCLTWHNNKSVFNINLDRDDIYNLFLRYSDDNFWARWLEAVIGLNQRYPVTNICLEDQTVITEQIQSILEKRNIKLHIDEKSEGKTWFFDSAAYDQLHHSEWCNQKWAKRIVDITYKK